MWEIGSWTWFSYAASTLEIVSAAAVALAGLAVLRKMGLRRTSRELEASLSSS